MIQFRWSLYFCVLLLSLFAHKTWSGVPTFGLHVFAEPQSLDPQVSPSSASNYIYNSVYRGLYRYHSRLGLIPEGAKGCVRSSLKLICRLNPKHRWSDGQMVKAEDYVRSFRRLVDPENRSPYADLLFAVKNAKAAYAGHKKPNEIGIVAADPQTLVVEFESEDPEFEYKTILPAMAPWPARVGIPQLSKPDAWAYSGPYKPGKYKDGRWLRLVPNPHYGLRVVSGKPPEAQVFFIDDDSAALSLYESGRLDFLRRLPQREVARFKGKKEFKKILMARFDYIGFGPALQAQPELRQALALGIEYPRFQTLFEVERPPGCPGIDEALTGPIECYKLDRDKARALLKKMKRLPALDYQFSRLGGDDSLRAAEWFQSEWKKNIGVEVGLKFEEQVMFLRRLRLDPPPLFRKGLALDRPTCLAALEIFSKDNPENYIRFDDAVFEEKLAALRLAISPVQRQKACAEALKILLNSYRLIPLGPMYFYILAKPDFTGWDLNELNQLDLTELRSIR